MNKFIMFLSSVAAFVAVKFVIPQVQNGGMMLLVLGVVIGALALFSKFMNSKDVPADYPEV